MIDIDNLTEDEALSLFNRLRNKFQWAGTILTLDDVSVTPEGEDSPDWGLELTPAMREAVANTWDWKKGIAEYGAETPTVELHPDGSFTVHATDEATHHTAQG